MLLLTKASFLVYIKMTNFLVKMTNFCVSLAENNDDASHCAASAVFFSCGNSSTLKCHSIGSSTAKEEAHNDLHDSGTSKGHNRKSL